MPVRSMKLAGERFELTARDAAFPELLRTIPKPPI